MMIDFFLWKSHILEFGVSILVVFAELYLQFLHNMYLRTYIQ